ncbi:MAG: helix-turn-helix transcriptional regulator [Saprospiraceae bacterium]|nr:helix-turn-helix transcriptional regulator [Candidatus Opimibacter skivensis]
MHQDKLISALKDRRDNLRLTQETLAEMSGVNLRTLKQFERGKGNPTLDTLQKLADVVGLELVFQVKKMNPTP